MASDDDHSFKHLNEAYDKLVSDERDVEGMVAFARFYSVRRRISDDGLAQAYRLTQSEATVFQEASERLINEYKDVIVEDRAPDIVRAAKDARLEGVEKTLVSELRARTGLGSAILANVIAWLITIGVTLLILYATQTPDLIELLRDLPQAAE